MLIVPPLFVEGGGLSQLPTVGARANFHPPAVGPLVLPPEAQLLDQGSIPLEILALQVVQEPAAASDELEQAAPRVMVLRVRAEMLRQLVDARGQQCDLHLRRAGVGLTLAVLADDLLFCFLAEGH